MATARKKLFPAIAEVSAFLITLAEAINLLPGEKFIRVHRSYIVNISKIEKIERHQITMGKLTIPVSEAYREVLTGALKNKNFSCVALTGRLARGSWFLCYK